jgi:hypothetical protein
MRIIFDAQALRMYPVGQPSEFTGGTETMVHKLAQGLSAQHDVHVVCPDLDLEEQRGERLWYWGPRAHPTQADAVVLVHSLEFVGDYAADYLIFATNGVDPELGPNHSYANGVDAFPVFSEKHGELLRQFRPTVAEEKCHITGLGINLGDYGDFLPLHDMVRKVGEHYAPKDKTAVPGRLLYANDPARGLWHVLDIFDYLKQQVPHAGLHISYDFDRQFEHHRWRADMLAEALWDCKRRIESTDGVTSLGGLDRAGVVREQLECQVHVMPSDPPNVGSQIHGITQMECAAAGAALVLSDTEAFREVFGSAARILPLPGKYRVDLERRFDAQDWAENIAAVMGSPDVLTEMSRDSRWLAEQNTWAHVVGRWEEMLSAL